MLPPLPAYHLQPKPDLLSPWISDFGLSLILPVVAYWSMSLVFHLIDTWDLFPQYRLHTPEEILRRNHATRYEVARDVVVQQLIQIATGAALGLLDGPDTIGREQYDVAVWATRVRLLQRALPSLLGLLGINAVAISKSMSASHPFLAGALAGGHYPMMTEKAGTPAFAAWELLAANFIYHILIPALQFLCAIFVLDTWQYFLHRLMHVNRWLYTNFHSRHHRLYVPYAYGALYNHPFEGFLLDTLGAAIGFKISGMTMRQSIFFFTFSTIKTVDDHCGYAFPWDPLQLVTSNNAAYHDIHHQTWGVKANFSQPFFTFWDTLLGTKYKGPRTDRLADKKQAANSK
ncbi:Sphingolipid C4-hydroxylase SUR2 [Escovopsis weberi]|uniref:Sphingolipid C4-hydroxylase SUR2 n=1 Tax=Escovopsis weberi TaxID=150374 RepID=A0A0M9VRI3_ESCWE|nr:Sphingolipid C4-hydroxylase SUR2 [Escovopsis weberi]